MVNIINFVSALQIYSGFDSHSLFTATIIFIYVMKYLNSVQYILLQVILKPLAVILNVSCLFSQ